MGLLQGLNQVINSRCLLRSPWVFAILCPQELLPRNVVSSWAVSGSLTSFSLSSGSLHALFSLPEFSYLRAETSVCPALLGCAASNQVSGVQGCCLTSSATGLCVHVPAVLQPTVSPNYNVPRPACLPLWVVCSSGARAVSYVAPCNRRWLEGF